MLIAFFLLLSSFGLSASRSATKKLCEEELEKSRIYLESIRGKMLGKEEQRRDQRIQAHFLSDPKGACDGPRFRDITTVTSQQLGAFLSIFAVSRGLPLCSVCDSMVNKAEAVLFEPGSKELPHAEQVLRQYIRANLPSAEAICSALLPACYHNYTTNCKRLIDLIFPKNGVLRYNQFLLNESRIQSFMDMLTTRYLSGFCAKVCHLFRPNIFWDGIGYTDCMSSTTNYLKDLLQKAATVFMPEKFCFKTIHWCDSFPTPSITQCLKEFCEEGVPPQWQDICKMIPNDRAKADAFLNIKRYQ
ncbi:unnamed protein product [Gongylonema pulchrum]|uniref:Saposin B-type domain-containing protein n=1 Tax=Gongylonema pulchrum TaxID=637853 RepID=A0A183DQ33_9BILA|nr:unnamed protein product [Gongylonema pulchrum]